MPNRRSARWMLVFAALFLALPTRADLILGAAPREGKDKEEAMYAPIAELLTKVTGQKVTFRWGDNFLIYTSEMRKGAYDIVFDGPHLVGWRIAKLQHAPLVKFPGMLNFVVIAKKSQDRIRAMKDLEGRTVCALPPPNLATLVVLSEFDNPSRQPLVVEVQSFANAYQGVLAGKCMAGVMQAKLYYDIDKDAKAAKVLFDTRPLPNQAFTAGPRVPPEMRDKITTALLSPEGAVATQKLREAFKVQNLLAATADEYKDLGRLLRDTWGFEH